MLEILLPIVALAVTLGFTHTFYVRWTGSNAVAAESTSTYTADAEYNLDVTVPALSTNYVMAATIDVSQMKSLYLYSSVDLTLETNSGSSPAATVSLLAGKAKIWAHDSGETNPFGSTDVTGLFATCTPEATFKMRALIDPTV